MTAELSEDFFKSLVDFEACNERVHARLRALEGSEPLLRFFTHYASWNGKFANGVSALSALIGGHSDVFVERGLPRVVADRSNYVASFFFDAARDEYDDHINPLRDSHRCLAQATLIGMAQTLGVGTAVLDEPEATYLVEVNAGVDAGYTGQHPIDRGPVARIFHGMGYHLGSELLADREFSIIDEYLRQHHPALVEHLMRKTIKLAGAEHRCYAWIGIHSGHGGGVEADHFDHAVRGAREGLVFLLPSEHDHAVESLKRGFLGFEADHRRFFSVQAD